MIKTFTLGLILGLAGSVGLLYAVPVVDLERERSIIDVQPNGGNREVFHANLPADRIMAGRVGTSRGFPEGLEWPDFSSIESSQTELFKFRNADDRVVGVASRIAGGGAEPFVEWALHLPARGTMYVVLDAGRSENDARIGRLRAGTREFIGRSGPVLERFEAAADSRPDSEGRLVLVTALVGPQENDVPAAEAVP